MSGYDHVAEADALARLNAERDTLAPLIDMLRAKGVTSISLHPNGAVAALTFGEFIVAAPAAQPSTPEHPGTTVAQASRDIFDVLSSGVIPGAPRPDGYPPDPE
ncbi:MAG: hypothetical protein ABJA82_05390 [Myxococcales bacterium]